MAVSWIAPADLPPLRPALPGYPEEGQEAAWAALCAWATEILYALSGRRWAGEQESEVELLAPPASAVLRGGLPTPELVAGEVRNAGCCGEPQLLRLPHGAVTAVTAVSIGGELLAADSYRLTRGRYLEDRSGRGWPTCPPGAVVAYRHGRPPPEGGVQAARALTLAVGRAEADPSGAGQELPNLVTAITRQGVTISRRSVDQVTSAGRTGLYEVDAWLAAVNPSGRRRRATVWSPDVDARAYAPPTP